MIHLTWLNKILASLFMATVAYASENGIVLAPEVIEQIKTQQAIVDYIPQPDEKDVFSLIHYFATENKVNLSLAFDLGEIESGFDYLARNPKSSAKGTYMFTDATWKELCEGDVLSAYDNVKCAMETIHKEGLRRWTIDPNTKAKLKAKGYDV